MPSTIYDVTENYLEALSDWDMTIAPSDKTVNRLRNNFDSLILRDDIRRGPTRNMRFAVMMMDGLQHFYQHVIKATDKVPLTHRQEAVVEAITAYPFPEVELVKNLALVLIEVWKTTLIEMTPRNMNASVAAMISFVLSGVNLGLLKMPRVSRFDISPGESLTASIAMAIVWRALKTAVEQKESGEL